MKDWTGNKATTFSTLGASSHSNYERAENDYYATDPVAIDRLFEQYSFDKKIWECACGGNHLSNRISDYGHDVFATDIIDRNGVDEIVDFLQTEKEWEGDIITNPPYKYAQQFVEKGLSILKPNKKLALFLKLTFLEGQKRKEMFRKHPPKYVYVFSKRVQCAMNGDKEMFKKSSAACYAWFIWEKEFTGEPIIRWL